MFESEFAKIEYIQKENAVFHIWKKEAHFDDYRKPVNASLELLREHPGSLLCYMPKLLKMIIGSQNDSSCT